LIQMDSVEMALDCVRPHSESKQSSSRLSGSFLDGRRLSVFCTAEKNLKRKFFRKKDLRGTTNMVMVWNAYHPKDDGTGSETVSFVHSLCSPFGGVRDVALIRDHSGFSKMGAAVLMDSPRAAEAVFDGLHGQNPGGRLMICTAFKSMESPTKTTDGFHTLCIAAAAPEGDAPLRGLSKTDIHQFAASHCAAGGIEIVDIQFEGERGGRRVAALYLKCPDGGGSQHEAPGQALDAAVSKLDGGSIESVAVRVWAKAGRSHSAASRLKDSSCWIRVSPLRRTVTDRVLQSFVEAQSNGASALHEDVGALRLFHHFSDDDVPGFAYLKCESTTIANEMVLKLRTKSLENERVWAEWAEHPDHRLPVRCWEAGHKEVRVVEITNLHCTVGEEEVRALIAIHCEGKLLGDADGLSISMKIDGDGFPLGVSRVRTRAKTEAARIRRNLDGVLLRGIPMKTRCGVPTVGESLRRRRSPRNKNPAKISVLKGMANMALNVKGDPRGKGKITGKWTGSRLRGNIGRRIQKQITERRTGGEQK